MSVPFRQYGAFTGIAGADCRVEIGGKGRKNILAVTASYQLAPTPAIADPDITFQGRLVIVQGQLGGVPTPLGPPPPDYYVNEQFNDQKILFDVRFSNVGPHPFFYPIAQQEGSPQSDEDSVVNVILCAGWDVTWAVGPPVVPGVNLYIPTLTVSGQTVFSNNGGSFV
jgi:hypothetical protein